jgi:Cu-Zn family superoxide dismutase
MTAEAGLLDLRGFSVAQAAASQAGGSIRIMLDASGLPPGVYGAHIHAIGRCDPPDFSSAGPHWNPGGQQHGRNNPQGMHLGDLPNLMVGANGRGTLEITMAGALLSDRGAALLDEDGAAIVIHERQDDYRTDPSGNSGARIACGIFR